MKDSDLIKKKLKKKPAKVSVKVSKPKVPKSTKGSSTLESSDTETLILLVQEQRRTIQYLKAELDFLKQSELENLEDWLPDEDDYYD